MCEELFEQGFGARCPAAVYGLGMELEPRDVEAEPLEPRDVIRIAILERRPVSLEYRYPGQGLRTIHPHALYRSADGRLHLNAYQVDGYTSRRRSLPGWRLFDLNQVTVAELLDGRFDLAPGFNPAAPQYSGGVVASA